MDTLGEGVIGENGLYNDVKAELKTLHGIDSSSLALVALATTYELRSQTQLVVRGVGYVSSPSCSPMKEHEETKT